jgi:transcriptional regulator with XRE-family HTH domain
VLLVCRQCCRHQPTVAVVDFAQELHRLRTERGWSLAQLAERVPCNRAYLGQLEHGERRPSPQLAQRVDAALGAGGALVAIAEPRSTQGPSLQVIEDQDDEFEALELSRRVAASDIGATTLAGLEDAADRFAIAYQSTPPSVLLPDVRRYLRYVGQLVDKPATLDQRRRLLVVGAWLSLLAATIDIDLQQRPAANARLMTAASLAQETGHTEIGAWCLETQAWDALTGGRLKLAVDLSQAAQQMAPQTGSAFIQATAQEGRAWARLGERTSVRKALSRVEHLVSPLPLPDQPEHHFRYDPAKQVAYTVTALSWIGDPAAEDFAREALARLESGRDGAIRPRRIATAHVDLALALVRIGNLDEAAGHAIVALRSGRIVPSSAWRVQEILAAVQEQGLAESLELLEAYEGIAPPHR